ncbi:hypothetical protein TWF102_003817 [Orbilia oligospora]|uniref:Uncharacterized protein n=1 Tax=Orbilia oligospora TaxID=2813651 RepID=A0A7C8N1M4_ORBOL|nr:hypothetical protein TWF102_003817 [Orbilia oligospora]KAF3114060.1 hypothetical protein TWF103_001501 [Orbilia oligospora]
MTPQDHQKLSAILPDPEPRDKTCLKYFPVQSQRYSYRPISSCLSPAHKKINESNWRVGPHDPKLELPAWSQHLRCLANPSGVIMHAWTSPDPNRKIGCEFARFRDCLL